MYKSFLNGNDFQIRAYRYEISEKFLIFSEEQNRVFIIYKDYKDYEEMNHITISAFSTNLFTTMITLKDAKALSFADDCIVYKSSTLEDKMVDILWADKDQNILLEATLDETLVTKEIICNSVNLKTKI